MSKSRGFFLNEAAIHGIAPLFLWSFWEKLAPRDFWRPNSP